MVREAVTSVPASAARSHKAEVELRVKPGKYTVELSLLAGAKRGDPAGTRIPL
jgi:hypothetical protein